jgi:hypothetical protein
MGMPMCVEAVVAIGVRVTVTWMRHSQDGDMVLLRAERQLKRTLYKDVIDLVQEARNVMHLNPMDAAQLLDKAIDVMEGRD